LHFKFDILLLKVINGEKQKGQLFNIL